MRMKLWERNVAKTGISSRRMSQSIPGAAYRISLEITILMKEIPWLDSAIP